MISSSIPSVLIFLILMIGFSHGALDDVLAKYSGVIKTRKHTIFFYIFYVCGSITIAFVWILFPILSLILFLIISIFHFGSDYTRPFLSLAYGTIIISTPCWFGADQVQSIFSALTFDADTRWLVEILKGLGIIAAISIIFFTSKIQLRIIIEIATIIGIGIFFEPFTYFCIYFTFFHSTHHFYEQRFLFKKVNKNTLVFRFLFNLTLCAILFYMAFNLFDYKSITNYLYQLIFIGLAALTVPHMCVIFLAKQKLTSSY
tara:strand:- start:1326 stop:2102 length:777 start_codon:yes stop_codon:yes gene_type:complete